MCLERIYTHATCPHHLINHPSICLQQLSPSPTHLLLQQEQQIQGSCSLRTSNSNSNSNSTINFSTPYPNTYPLLPPGPTTLILPPGTIPFPTTAPGTIWHPLPLQPGTPTNQQTYYPIPQPPPPLYSNYNLSFPHSHFPQTQVPQAQAQQTQPQITTPPPIPIVNSPQGRDFRVHTRPDGTREILEHFPSQAPGTAGSERRGWNDVHGWDKGVPPPEGFAFWRDRPSRPRGSDGAAVEENMEGRVERGGEVGGGEDEGDRMRDGESRDEGTEAGASSGEGGDWDAGVGNGVGNGNSEATTTAPENKARSPKAQYVKFEESENMGTKGEETSDITTVAASSLDSKTRESESSGPSEGSSGGSSMMSTPTTSTATSTREAKSRDKV